MASPSDQPSASAAQPVPAQDSRPASGHDALSTSPVEMKTLPASTPEPAPTHTTAQTFESHEPASIETPTPHAPAAESTSSAAAPSRPEAPADLVRSETEAIGPSTDTPAAIPDHTNGPVVVIMLLLTTGARHPYKIDGKYLKKRNVEAEESDPYNIGVYTLKELIWRDWREEWEQRPTSPSSIRLIHFGRMLDDKSLLKDCRFQTDTPNVVHMTVKPQEVVDEDDAKTGKGGHRRDGDEESHAGCRCVIL